MPARHTAAFAAHCVALGLRSVRTVRELNAAYRPLIQQWHPDRHHGHAGYSMALERATAINEAYAFLSAVLEHELVVAPIAPRVARRASRQTAPDGFPDTSVLEIFVKPSNIISVGYNSATADLFVKYLGHRVYRYLGVPASAFEALLSAPSASAFVTEHIDREYKSEALKRTT